MTSKVESIIYGVVITRSHAANNNTIVNLLTNTNDKKLRGCTQIALKGLLSMRATAAPYFYPSSVAQHTNYNFQFILITNTNNGNTH